MRIVVLDGYCLNPGDLSWSGLERLGEVTVYDRTPESLLLERARGAEALLTNKTPLGRETLAALPELRYVGVLATGYNVVDAAAARERGIVVTNVPAYGTASVAQLTIALLLELCHQVGVHAAAVRTGEWAASQDWSFWKTPQVELAGKTFGCIGLGRIGGQTARIAEALGMRVVVHSRSQGISLEALLEQSDVVSLHCPLFPETRELLGASQFQRMKPSAFLLNTSRGPLVVEKDLADALNAGVLAGAGVDVLSVEPPVAGSPLFTARNCIVTPHIAWATREARARLMEIATNNVAAFAAGASENVVN
ncbi:MAG: D-2-hydroxyacid dehydrogenase [Acidobacteriaceae bacterium]|nr:D-2-hydroxyacid dehydrogenase [Acidobacteriaceae bacterium]